MDKQPLKIAAIVAVIVLALAGLGYGVKSMSAAEDYTPSPGLSSSKPMGATSAPPMPGTAPPPAGGWGGRSK